MKQLTRFSRIALLLLVMFCLVGFGGNLSSIAQDDEPGEDMPPEDTSPDDENMPDTEPPPDDEDLLYKEPPPDEEEDPEWEYDEGPSEPGPTDGFEGAEDDEGEPTFGFEGSIVGVDAFSPGPVSNCLTNEVIEPTGFYTEIEYDPDAEPPHETEDIRSITLEAPGYESLVITEFHVMSISLLFVSINLIVPTQADLCMEPIEYDVEGVDYSQEDTFTHSAHVKKVLAGNKVEIEILNEKGEVVRTVIAKNSSGKSLQFCQNILVTGTPINVVGGAAGQPSFDIKSVVSNPKKGQHALTDVGMLEWDAKSKSWQATPTPSEGDYDYAGGRMYRFQDGKWTPVTPRTTYVDPTDSKAKTFKRCVDVIAKNGLFHCRGTDKSGNLMWSRRRRWYHCKCRRAVNGIAHYSSSTSWTEVPKTTCTFAYVYGQGDVALQRHIVGPPQGLDRQAS